MPINPNFKLKAIDWPAFPSVRTNDTEEYSSGLSKRDLFSAIALHAILTVSYQAFKKPGEPFPSDYGLTTDECEQIAETAFDLGQAMLEEGYNR